MPTEVLAQKYMRMPEAIAYSGASRSTLMRLVEEGKLHLYRLRERVTLFDREEIDALIRGEAQ